MAAGAPDESTDGRPWILACAGPGADTNHEITQVRSLSDEEAALARSANAILHSITSPDSPYHRLEARLDAFDRGVSEAIGSMEGGSLAHPEPPLGQRFNDALYAFRVFLDHTPHLLRRRHAKQSAPEAVFRDACSAEYDQMFAYRLAYNLRNVSQHRSDVLHVSFRKRINTPGAVDAFISAEVLDDAIDDSKWQASVRKELKSHPRPIDGTDLLKVLRGCVQRIFSRTLLAQRADIGSAIKTIQTLAEGIDCGEGRLVLVAPADLDPDIPGGRLALTLQGLEVESARLVAAALTQAERVLWPRFAVQVSNEWLGRQATVALLAALAGDPSVISAGLTVVESAGTFVGVSARSAYAARSAVARAVGRAVANIQDASTGPAILVQ